jgi:hypothetical protein
VIERLRNALAPRRTAGRDVGYRRLLRWAALPVTDRRWAAPLCAVALGFGLFAGVAIGPGASGTLAGAPIQLVEMPSLAGGGGEAPEEEEPVAAPPGPSGGFGEEEGEEAAFVPVAPVTSSFEASGKEQPSNEQAAPKEEEKEAGEPEAQQLAGIVVHVNPAAGSYTVAEAGGTMSAVHAGKPPAAGSEVEVPIRALANGTLAEAGTRHRTGDAAEAELSGIVSFAGTDPAAPAYTISNRGSSVLVHVPPDPAGALPPLPVLGAYATATVAIEAGVLRQRQLSSGGAPFTHVEIEGIVAAVEAETAKLLVSTDDVRESGQDVAVSVPPGIDFASLTVGDSVLAGADIGADGSLSLTGLASDERLKGAGDSKAIQGDLVPAKEKGQE